jgi:hypothetical protein
MTKSEATCYSCGSPAPWTVKEKAKGKGFSRLATIMFFASAALTVASLFFDHTPPVTVCVAVTVVLMLVKSSADQLGKNRT